MSEEKYTITTSEWSDNIESVIQDIGEKCKSYKWMNIIAAKYSSYWYKVLMYILICIGPIAGVLETSQTLSNEEYSSLKIWVIVFSFLSGILSSIVKFSKFEQKTITHKNIAAKYSSLEGNIRRQLSLSRNERVNAGKYLEWISISYDDLFNSMPLISDNIYQKWLVFAKENNMSILENVQSTFKIREDAKPLKQLGTTNEIDINTQNNTVIRMSGTDTMKKEKERRRTDIYNSNAELNQYGDQVMNYQLNRLYGMTK